MSTKTVFVSLLALSLSVSASAYKYELTVSGVAIGKVGDPAALAEYGAGYGSTYSETFLLDTSAPNLHQVPLAQRAQYSATLESEMVNGHAVTEFGTQTAQINVTYDSTGLYQASGVDYPLLQIVYGVYRGSEVAVSLAGPQLLHTIDFPDPSEWDTSKATIQNYNILQWVGPNGTGYLSSPITNIKIRAVPEPAPIAALGLGSLALLRRRRR